MVRRFVDGNRYLSHLWLVPLGRGRDRPRQLTEGVVRDDRPRFSPDGRSISFRRRRRDQRDHVRRIDRMTRMLDWFDRYLLKDGSGSSP